MRSGSSLKFLFFKAIFGKIKPMKKLPLLCFLLISIASYAQKKQNIYYLKDSGKEVFVPDSADFIRVVQEPDSGEKDFNLMEFYKGGTKKVVGKVSSFSPRLVHEGTLINYNKKGIKVSSLTYKKGTLLGPAFYFFENGKVKKQVEYLPRGKDLKSFDTPQRMVFLADSLGNVLVENGNGHAVEIERTKDDEFLEEGDYKDGAKDGTWTGKYKSGKSSYTESYEMGKFIAGVNTVDNKKIEYKIVENPPTYKGGVTRFYEYLGRSVRYPKDAMERRIMGSVIISFVIEKDGKVVDAKVDKSLTPSTDEEALRVVTASPNWEPGLQRGVPVRVKYNIPITFSLR